MIKKLNLMLSFMLIINPSDSFIHSKPMALFIVSFSIYLSLNFYSIN